MPTYEYACKDCGKQLEVVQSFADDALTECPTCSGTLRKVWGSVGISFKGSGFYKTDSRASGSSSKPAAAGATTSSSSSDSSSTSSSSSDNSSSSSSTSTSSDSKAAS